MTINRDGDVIALYREDEIICPRCTTQADKADASLRDESLEVEELAGAVDNLWCDRCGAQIFSAALEERAAAERAEKTWAPPAVPQGPSKGKLEGAFEPSCAPDC